MLGGALLIFSIIRLLEFISIKGSQEESARAIATIIWFIPLMIFICCFQESGRIDSLILSTLTGVALIYFFIHNCSVFTDQYQLISPDRLPGETNGLFSWLHLDPEGNVLPLFFPFLFYLTLAVAVIYMTATFVSNSFFWILFGSMIGASIIGSIIVATLWGNLSHYFWSMFSFVMIAVGTLSIFLAPG
jgi:hypothetical protein